MKKILKEILNIIYFKIIIFFFLILMYTKLSPIAKSVVGKFPKSLINNNDF
jgi:hypothetical protein